MRYVLKFTPTGDELCHHGIKGMRWGVRRYQNADGTLTAAGKKRYDHDTKDLSDGKKAKYKANPDKWVNEDLGAGRRLADESTNLTNKLRNANEAAMRKQPRMKMDLSSMSDQQMRNEINRALLERQYPEMFAPKKSNRGRQVVNDVLTTTGTILGVAGTSLGIALAIRDLKSKV